MNEFELQRLYEAQLGAQVADTDIPAQDRNAAAAVLAASRRLLGAMLRPLDEHRTWVFSDPHFEDEKAGAVFNLTAVPLSQQDAETLKHHIRTGPHADSKLAQAAMGGNPEADQADINALVGRKATLSGSALPSGPPPPGTRCAEIAIGENGRVYIP